MILYIASDHAGYDLKKKIMHLLPVIDVGAFSTESVDYPIFARALCEQMKKNDKVMGILICGSGIGMSIVANRYSHIRAALCHCAEFAELARKHNNANVIVLPARFISLEEAGKCIRAFLDTEFEGGRHQRRLSLI
ncbi:MAG: ribose 5-phosphate isomerase B [Flammeovirgaceae bacterium]|nr:ribose 5-phosphate isomerase B [Flammeovirgaceae bacterium]|tara:strand:+ start:90 stop:497 length:408 start_codon:yes stop_codon:yes gene_type:complete